MSKIVAVLFAGLIVVFATGCQTNPFAQVKNALMTPEGSMFGGGRVNIASANQMMYEEFEGFTDEQFVHLIDPKGNSYSGEWSSLTSATKVKALNTAFLNANEHTSVARRSQIQDRLIAASNQRCNIYATHLKKISTNINGFFGTITTAVAGAGAIVTGAEAARILAGIAGITSGTRAELNQAIFETVTTSVIIPAFQERRKRILQEILVKRNQDIAIYTVEGAIADAINYHGACSIDAGVSEAQKSLHKFSDVGLAELQKVQAELTSSRTLIALIWLEDGVLTKFESKLKDYQSQANALKQSSEKDQLLIDIKKEIDKSAKDNTDATKNGEYRTKASTIDNNLPDLYKKYTLAISNGSDSDKKIALTNLQAQQFEAGLFQENLNSISNQISSRIEKLREKEKKSTP